jgi:hypothetical protein
MAKKNENEGAEAQEIDAKKIPDAVQQDIEENSNIPVIEGADAGTSSSVLVKRHSPYMGGNFVPLSDLDILGDEDALEAIFADKRLTISLTPKYYNFEDKGVPLYFVLLGQTQELMVKDMNDPLNKVVVRSATLIDKNRDVFVHFSKQICGAADKIVAMGADAGLVRITFLGMAGAKPQQYKDFDVVVAGSVEPSK